MANQARRFGSREDKALNLVGEWLRLEDVAQPRRKHAVFRQNAYSLGQSVYRTKIPTAIGRAQPYLAEIHLPRSERSEQTVLRLGAAVLGAAAQAQHGYFLGNIARGVHHVTAAEQSWKLLQGFKKHVAVNQIPLPPPIDLERPIQDVLAQYTGHAYGDQGHTFIGMVAYAAAVVAATGSERGAQFIIPDPANRRDPPDLWDYDPPLNPRPYRSRL